MDRSMPTDGTGPSLLAQLRRRWLLVALTTLVAAVAAYVISTSRPASYTASTVLLVQPSTPEGTILGAQTTLDSGTQTRATSTIAAVARTQPVWTATSRALKGRLTPSEVRDKVSVSPNPDANVLNVGATDASPADAAQLANVYAETFVQQENERSSRAAGATRRALQRRYQALTRSERRSTTGQELKAQVQRLSTLEVVGTGEVSVLERADPPPTSNSSVFRNVLLGALFGLLLGAGLALVRDQLDRRVRNSDDLERILGLPELAHVPNSSNLRRAKPLSELAPQELEAFRMLWTRLRFGTWSKSIRRVLITSPGPAEGKSLVCWYLACTAAESGAKVLLVEADLRRPVLSDHYDVPHAPGVLALVRDQLALEDAITHVEVGAGAQLDVLPAGGAGTGLVSLPGVERLLTLLRDDTDEYDLVVVDAPPIGAASETIPLSTAVDGVLVASRSGRTTHDGLLEVHEELERMHAHTLGIVRDGAEARGYYGYTGRQAVGA